MPALTPHSAPSGVDAAAQIPLRLVAWGGGVGIELYDACRLGPLRISELVWTLPGIRFPVDLSGGVRGFRSRRGELSTLRVELSHRELETWLQTRLRSALGGLRSRPRVWPTPGGLGIGVVGAQGAVAFDVFWAPDLGAARWVVGNARGAGFPGPPIVEALRLMESSLGEAAQRRGRCFELPKTAQWLVQRVLPDVGVRTPATGRVVLSALESDDESSWWEAGATAPPALGSAAQRHLHLADLLRDADDALVLGRLEEARSRLLEASELAPRHPEVAAALASLDLEYGERRESALGILNEALPVTSFGLLGARLLASTGDLEGAELAVDRAAQSECYAPLAALIWHEAAALFATSALRLQALDSALAASAGCEPARRARFALRVELGDLVGARADAEHLEAQASGAEARHEAVMGAGRCLVEAGYAAEAGVYFERALRYCPDDEGGLLGLALALVATGRAERAGPLLRRAAASPEPRVAGRARLELARLLAEHARDLPQAIAQVRQISAESGHGLEARALEADFRARLGDLTGALQAYSKVKELADLGPGAETPSAIAALRLATRLCREELGDALAAERFLASAVRLAPRDETLLAAYRDAAREAARLKLPQRSESELLAPSAPLASVSTVSVAAPPAQARAEVERAVTEDTDNPELQEFIRRFGAMSPGEREATADELRQSYLSSPSAPGVFERLCHAFVETAQLVELHALLASAYEDADEGERPQLKEQLEHALELLASSAPDVADREIYAQQLAILRAPESAS